MKWVSRPNAYVNIPGTIMKLNQLAWYFVDNWGSLPHRIYIPPKPKH